MRNVWTIARRDFRIYFASPIAYIVIALFLFIMGWMFFNSLNHYFLQNLQYQQFNMGKGTSITDGIVRPLYGNMNVVLLFLMPFITMRLIAEERKQHTIELLLTSPVSLTQIILGKFLASFCLVFVLIVFPFSRVTMRAISSRDSLSSRRNSPTYRCRSATVVRRHERNASAAVSTASRTSSTVDD